MARLDLEQEDASEIWHDAMEEEPPDHDLSIIFFDPIETSIPPPPPLAWPISPNTPGRVLFLTISKPLDPLDPLFLSDIPPTESGRPPRRLLFTKTQLFLLILYVRQDRSSFIFENTICYDGRLWAAIKFDILYLILPSLIASLPQHLTLLQLLQNAFTAAQFSLSTPLQTYALQHWPTLMKASLALTLHPDLTISPNWSAMEKLLHQRHMLLKRISLPKDNLQRIWHTMLPIPIMGPFLDKWDNTTEHLDFSHQNDTAAPFWPISPKLCQVPPSFFHTRKPKPADSPFVTIPTNSTSPLSLHWLPYGLEHQPREPYAFPLLLPESHESHSTLLGHRISPKPIPSHPHSPATFLLPGNDPTTPKHTWHCHASTRMLTVWHYNCSPSSDGTPSFQLYSDKEQNRDTDDVKGIWAHIYQTFTLNGGHILPNIFTALVPPTTIPLKHELYHTWKLPDWIQRRPKPTLIFIEDPSATTESAYQRNKRLLHQKAIKGTKDIRQFLTGTPQPLRSWAETQHAIPLRTPNPGLWRNTRTNLHGLYQSIKSFASLVPNSLAPKLIQLPQVRATSSASTDPDFRERIFRAEERQRSAALTEQQQDALVDEFFAHLTPTTGLNTDEAGEDVSMEEL